MAITKSANLIFQLKATIRGSRPSIWRRLQVPADIRLDKLHAVLQCAFGWTNSHLHQFVLGNQYFGKLEPEIDDIEVQDEKKFRLDQLINREKSKIVYEYDFGDNWQHELLIEKILAPEAGTRYPCCVDGKRAGPPEDCGGVGGYEELQAAIANTAHNEHDNYLEWLGGEFDPEAFDREDINRALRRIK